MQGQTEILFLGRSEAAWKTMLDGFAYKKMPSEGDEEFDGVRVGSLER